MNIRDSFLGKVHKSYMWTSQHIVEQYSLRERNHF